MRKGAYILGTLLLVVALVYGYNNNKNEVSEETTIDQHEAIETSGNSFVFNDNSELTEGIHVVLNTLQNLQNTLNDSPKDVKAINKQGLALEEKWDVIEKQVEETNKETYIHIEKTLYPLIAEAKRDKPNVENMKELIDKTIKRLTNFKEDLSF